MLRPIIKSTWTVSIETSTHRLLISEFKLSKPKKVLNLPLRKSNKSSMTSLAEHKKDNNSKHWTTHLSNIRFKVLVACRNHSNSRKKAVDLCPQTGMIGMILSI
jgi:hypothetical protein